MEFKQIFAENILQNIKQNLKYLSTIDFYHDINHKFYKINLSVISKQIETFQWDYKKYNPRMSICELIKIFTSEMREIELNLEIKEKLIKSASEAIKRPS